MPYINIANSATVFTTTGLRLNIVTVSGPQGPRGADGTGMAGLYVTGSSLISNAALTGAGSVSVFLNGNTIYFSGADTSFSGISGILDQKVDTLSGFLYAEVIATGNAAISHADGIGSIISGNLTQSGITLLGLINQSTGKVSSVNGASGALTVAGAGNISITTNGQTITVSGDTGTYANFATVANLALTGQQVWNAAQNNAINLSGNLIQTGATLNSQINSLSGFVDNVSGGLQTRITQTGAAAINYTNSIGINLSGSLTQTGITLGAKIDSLSGSINSISGSLESRIAQTGLASINYSNSIGSNLSGSLTQSGALLSAVKVTGSNIINTANFTGLGGTLVIYSGSQIFVSGAASLDHGDGINLSGNLTQTGIILNSKIDSLSGFVGNVSGALEARIIATGNSTVSFANGIGFALSGNLALTGQQAWNAANNNGINLSGNLTQTGVILNSKIDSLSGFVNNVSGGIEARITLTGQTAWTHGQNNALNLSGNLQLTGSNLQTQINNITAGTGNVLSNVVFTTGSQYIIGTKTFVGNTYIDNLFVTGSQIVVNTQDLYVGDNWITLNATGGARDSAIFISTGFTGASATGGILGFDVPSNTWRFGLGSQLTDLFNLPRIGSGEAIDAVDVRVTSLSGFTINVISGSLDTKIINTGTAVVNHANGIGIILSGNITTTGSTLDNKINSLSGFVSNVSGGLEARIIQTGNTAISHANGIGSILSGNIATTGSNLYILITGLSGQGVIDYATKIQLTNSGIILDNKINSVSGFIGNVSGGLESRIFQSGSAAINYTTSIGQTLSGNLTQTGSLLSAVKVTGSSIINSANFTGLGGTLVIYSGGQIFISGAAAATVGVTGVNGLQNAIYIAGTGGLTVTNVGQNILISGDSSISGALTQTGVSLGAKIDSVSGWANNLSGGLEIRITATGNAAIAYANSVGSIISGNLTQTGAALLSLITGSSKVTSLNNLTGALSLIGVGGIQVSTGIGIITLSGAGTASEQFFVTGIPSGVDNYYINFPRNFAQTPIIVPSIQTSGQTIYAIDISETSLSGFRALFSNDVLESGIFLNVYAIESGGISLGGSNGASVTITGSNPLSSADFTGIGGTVVYTLQNKVYISGGAGSAVTTNDIHPFLFIGA